ncbi:MAG: glutamate--tRNA ligase [Candidatus Latescibacterota bacterium]|nr:glutamate--tRNA ligase [Candidatus Latescibacterota bacterium]
MSSVRVRIAPSPTGPTHVGTAYQALFDKLYADKYGGRFILRIEDTDQERSRDEYETQLINSLKWLGLDWDEGPDVGGDYGPYRQSERLELYREHAKILVEKGRAYYCFCTSDRLSEMRADQEKHKTRQGYDGRCRNLSSIEVDQCMEEGHDHVVRVKMPEDGVCKIADKLRGNIELDFAESDDQVILKSDGFPTYHLAVVVDDFHMRISHVIRGEEWITSTPKHLVLYDAFGWDPPEFIHLPLLLNPDGTKMSKRKNPTSIEYYRRAGYSADALLNYLALMAYPSIKEEEKFTLSELAKEFDVGNINLGGSIFDMEKLNWLNGRYLREERTPQQILSEMKQWLVNDEQFVQIISLLQKRMETLGDFMPKAAFFFARDVSPTEEELLPKGREAGELSQMFQTAVWALDGTVEWGTESVESKVRIVADYWGWPVRDVTVPLTVALTGSRVGPPLFETVILLGIDIVRMRLLKGIETLGGLSKKKAKKLEKEWKKSDLY